MENSNPNSRNLKRNEKKKEESNDDVPKKQKRYRILSEERRKKEKLKNKENEKNFNKRCESKKKSLEVKQDELKEKLLKIIFGIKRDKEEKMKEKKEKERKDKDKEKKEKKEKEKEKKDKEKEKEKEKKEKEREKEERSKKIKEEKKKEKNKKEKKNKLIEEDDDDEKIFYQTSFDFHKSRLTKIKFRKIKDNKDVSNKDENINISNRINKSMDKDNKKKEKEPKKDNKLLKKKVKSIENLFGNLNENLNINKEKKKSKKTLKKKTKKKKKDSKIMGGDDHNDPSESFLDRTEEEESSMQDDKLSKSVQERKVENKKIFKIKEKNEKEKEKEKEIKLAKNEIIKKLSEKPEKNIFYNIETPDYKETDVENDVSLPPKISNIFDYDNDDDDENEDDDNKFNNSKIKKEEKIENEIMDKHNDSLLKREQIINAGLVNSSLLNYNERKRREQLEKDLADEINKDDLTEEPITESEIDINNKNDEEDNYVTSTRRTCQNTQNLDNEPSEKNNNNEYIYTSFINEEKYFDSKNNKKVKGNSKSKIYTPKKAVLAKENSQTKFIKFNRHLSKVNKPNKNNKNKSLKSHSSCFNTSFNSLGNEKKTKFKMFNEYYKKSRENECPTYNTNIETNKSISIDHSSYIINKNNVSDMQKYNLRHNKVLYVKKSPTKNYLNNTNHEKINYDEKSDANDYYKSRTKRNDSPNGLYIHTFNNDKIQKVLINRFNTGLNPKKIINISTSEQNVSISNDCTTTTQGLNESTNDYANNTYYTNFNGGNNINMNKHKYSIGDNNKSFTFKRHQKVKSLQQKILPEINLEDLVLMENKYFNIIHNLGEKREIANDCFDLFNFYYNCTFIHCLLKLFNDPNIIKLNINYTLMSLLVSYDLSFEIEQLRKIYLLLLEMFIVNYRNLMLIAEYVTNRINKNNIDDIWINTLVNKIIKYKESQEGEEIDSFSNFGLTIIEKIKYNTHYLMQKIHYILLNYDENNNNNLLFFLKTINANSFDKINVFFKENILRENLGFGSLLASSLIKTNSINKKFNQPKAPFITFPSKKRYTLVLDLDESLIYLDRVKEGRNGTLKIRPGTFSFLEKIKKYYEVIAFSEAEQNYVDLVLNSLQEQKKYFDYTLYRQHTTIQNEEFIKDLSKIGRKLSNIIIVDNMPQNYRLQPENGILIKPFWGKDNNDDVLFSLSKILCKIAEEGGDLRDGICRYKIEIIKNVSSSYKEN